MQQIYGQRSISVPVGSYLIIGTLLFAQQQHVNINFSFSMMHTNAILPNVFRPTIRINCWHKIIIINLPEKPNLVSMA